MLPEAAGTVHLPGEEGKQRAAGGHLGGRAWARRLAGGQSAASGLLPGYRGPHPMARSRSRWAGAWLSSGLSQPVSWGQRKEEQRPEMTPGQEGALPCRGGPGAAQRTMTCRWQEGPGLSPARTHPRHSRKAWVFLLTLETLRRLEPHAVLLLGLCFPFCTRASTLHTLDSPPGGSDREGG